MFVKLGEDITINLTTVLSYYYDSDSRELEICAHDGNGKIPCIKYYNITKNDYDEFNKKILNTKQFIK